MGTSPHVFMIGRFRILQAVTILLLLCPGKIINHILQELTRIGSVFYGNSTCPVKILPGRSPLQGKHKVARLVFELRR